MNLPVLTREQVREVDRRAIEQLGISGAVLMENAGRGSVDIMLAEQLPEPFLICCGSGNNAGDGFVIARHLALRGKQVRVLLWTDPAELKGDAAANCRILQGCGIPLDVLAGQPLGEPLAAAVAEAETLVDALLGTGARGDPRPPLDEVIARLNAARHARRVAIDLPSGLDCDTGAAGRPTFAADHTITFVAAKPGLLADEAQPLVGKLHVADIGLPWRFVEQTGRR